MKQTSSGIDTSGLADGLAALVSAQWTMAKAMLKLASDAGSGMLGQISGMNTVAGQTGCCEVPEPCWMPLSLGQVECQLRPGDAGTVCLIVTNGDFRPHNYQFAATGKSAALVSFSQAGAVLGPKERIAVTATFTLPKDTQATKDCACLENDLLIWVRGCRNHCLRWRVESTTADCQTSGKTCCQDIAVNDDPDYVLHWYDHFYVARPCLGAPLPPRPNPVGVTVVP